jgi:hypothetical protein
MSNDTSGTLSYMPDNGNLNVQVANISLPAGDHPNKTPILISGFRDTRAFLACLRASLPWRPNTPPEEREFDCRPINC